MSISPSLIFSGECRQAISLYVSAFNADVQSLTTYPETGMTIPLGMEDRIANAVLTLDGGSLYLSDSLSHDQVEESTRIALRITGNSSQVQQATRILLEEGDRLPTIGCCPGDHVCTILDCFGVTWHIRETGR